MANPAQGAHLVRPDYQVERGKLNAFYAIYWPRLGISQSFRGPFAKAARPVSAHVC